MSEEHFNVAVFYADDWHQYVGRNLYAKEAVELAKRWADLAEAEHGAIRRIIITDDGDCTNFEWKHGEGVTFGRGECPTT